MLTFSRDCSFLFSGPSVLAARVKLSGFPNTTPFFFNSCSAAFGTNANDFSFSLCQAGEYGKGKALGGGQVAADQIAIAKF